MAHASNTQKRILLFQSIVVLQCIGLTVANWNLGNGSLRLSLGDDEQAIGVFNDSIFIIGGSRFGKQAEEYRLKNSSYPFINHDNVISVDFGGDGQYWTQKDHILYLIQPTTPSYIATFNMVSNQMTPNYTQIPTNINRGGCLATFDRYLYIVGGDADTNHSLNTLQVFDVLSKEWQANAPPMNELRSKLACVVSGNYLWVFGGASSGGRNHASFVDPLQSNERIPLVNMTQQNWEYVDPLPRPVWSLRCVTWRDKIYIIGGKFGWNGAYSDIVYAMDVSSGIITELAERMVYPTAWATPVIADAILYVFGGDWAKNDWMYSFLPTMVITQEEIWKDSMIDTTTMDSWKGSVVPSISYSNSVMNEHCAHGNQNGPACWAVCNGSISYRLSTKGFRDVSIMYDVNQVGTCTLSYYLPTYPFDVPLDIFWQQDNTAMEQNTHTFHRGAWDTDEVDITIHSANDSCCFVSNFIVTGEPGSLSGPYQVWDAELNFKKAASICRTEYQTDLVTIHDAEENLKASKTCFDFLLTRCNVNDQCGCWLGAYRLGGSNYWQWSDGTLTEDTLYGFLSNGSANAHLDPFFFNDPDEDITQNVSVKVGRILYDNNWWDWLDRKSSERFYPLCMVSDPTTGNPTENPSKDPSSTPTGNPSIDPTETPTNNPSKDPSLTPTDHPSKGPSSAPTDDPVMDTTVDWAEAVTTNYEVSIEIKTCDDHDDDGECVIGSDIIDEVIQSLNWTQSIGIVQVVDVKVVKEDLVIRLSVKTDPNHVLETDTITHHIEREIKENNIEELGEVETEQKDKDFNDIEPDDKEGVLTTHNIMIGSIVLVSVLVICAVILMCNFKRRKRMEQQIHEMQQQIDSLQAQTQTQGSQPKPTATENATQAGVNGIGTCTDKPGDVHVLEIEVPGSVKGNNAILADKPVDVSEIEVPGPGTEIIDVDHGEDAADTENDTDEELYQQGERNETTAGSIETAGNVIQTTAGND
eukprot:234152_1